MLNLKIGSKVLTGNAVNFKDESEYFEIYKIEDGLYYGRMSPALSRNAGYGEEGMDLRWNERGLEVPDGWEAESDAEIIVEFGECWSITEVLE